jgi:hypothetical protein
MGFSSMIVRSSFKCATCGQVHTVRIGMGQEARQTHRFPCVNCAEDMVVALNVDYQAIAHWTEAVDNAEFVDELAGAPIVNVDANFIIPERERHIDLAFPRLKQMREWNKVAEKHGSLVSLPDIPSGMLDQRPYRRPDYAGEWDLLRRAWSLHRRGRDHLARQKLEAASALLYKADPLHDLLDWLWRFVLFVGQPHYEGLFRSAMEVIRPLLRMPECADFFAYYDGVASDRSDRYFELMKAYFAHYGDFGQVHFHVARGLAVPAGNVASSVDFDATRMFYGNAFEAFASSVDILAYLNNMLTGRPFSQFEKLTQKEYLKLDKAGRFDAFAGVPAFAALCEERDNQLRNASHHGGMKLDRKTQTIRYRVGKGATGPEQRVDYASYLARSAKLFLQAMTLLRLEIMICYATGARPPLA